MGSGTGSGRTAMPRATRGSDGMLGWNLADLQKFTNRLSFTKGGNGEWTIDHPAFGGGQILEGTDIYNPTVKNYEVRVWNSDYEMEDTELFASLNAAKDWIKWRMASNFDQKKMNR